MSISLTSEQRDTIRGAVLTDLSVIGDIPLAIEHGEWETAKRYRRDCEELMRLLDDLGWEDQQPADVELTAPAEALLPVITRLLDHQIAAAADAASEWEADAAAADATCRALAYVEAALGGPRATEEP